MSGFFFGRNEDSEVLGMMAGGRIGGVDAVNGPEDEVVRGYPLTRDELLTLARHWYKEYLEIAVVCFLYAYSGGQERRIMAYACWRLNRVRAILGEAVVGEVMENVDAEFRERFGEEAWRLFTEGDEVGRDRLYEEDERIFEHLDRKRKY